MLGFHTEMGWPAEFWQSFEHTTVAPGKPGGIDGGGGGGAPGVGGGDGNRIYAGPQSAQSVPGRQIETGSAAVPS